MCRKDILIDDRSNDAKVEAGNGQTFKDVMLKDRNHPMDGNWNTLCLPFYVDEPMEIFEESGFDATLMELDTERYYDSAGNQLHYPSKDMTINSCRAYFQLTGLNANEASASRIVLGFGDGETTDIIEVRGKTEAVSNDDAWHTLDGHRLQGQPATKGVYITKSKTASAVF